MRFNANIAVMGLLALSPFLGAYGQEEEPAFREPLYFSDVDREQRTPQAVRVGGVIFVSAMSAPGDTIDEQLRTVYIRLQSVLGNYGLRMSDVAQERVYLKNGQSYESVKSARFLFYGEESAPASTVVEVLGFENAMTLVEIELIVVANPDSD